MVVIEEFRKLISLSKASGAANKTGEPLFSSYLLGLMTI
jgi:hypothetical protein